MEDAKKYNEVIDLLQEKMGQERERSHLNDLKFSKLEHKMEELHCKVDRVFSEMFLDNGKKSFQTRMDRQDRMNRIIIFVMTTIFIALITGFTTHIIETRGIREDILEKLSILVEGGI